jgi:hypothetical protein
VTEDAIEVDLEAAIKAWEPDAGPLRNIAELLASFRYSHLPLPLQAVSLPFAVLAVSIQGRLAQRVKSNHPRQQGNAYQAGVALQKLLEAKDAAVRAVLS